MSQLIQVQNLTTGALDATDAPEWDTAAEAARTAAESAVALASSCTPAEALRLLSNAYASQSRRAARMREHDAALDLAYAAEAIATCASEVAK
jgi:hypothetical protein